MATHLNAVNEDLRGEVDAGVGTFPQELDTITQSRSSAHGPAGSTVYVQIIHV